MRPTAGAAADARNGEFGGAISPKGEEIDIADSSLGQTPPQPRIPDTPCFSPYSFSADGSGIEAASEPTNCHVRRKILTAAGGALAVLLLVCALWTRGMRSRAVADQPTAALLT